jgi:hypothetical protein
MDPDNHLIKGKGVFAIRKLIQKEGITFDDVLLVPQESDVLPGNVDLGTWLTKRIKLNIPLMSDKVREFIAEKYQGSVVVVGQP